MSDESRSRISHPALLSMNQPRTYIPENLRAPLMNYLDYGRSPGSLLTAILDNNIQRAEAEAKTVSENHIFSIVRWLNQYAPMSSWGSESGRIGWSDARRRDQLKVA